MSEPARERKPPGLTPRLIAQHFNMLGLTASYKARYLHLLEQIDAAVLLVDPDTGAIVEASPSAAALTGLTTAQLHAIPLTALLVHQGVPRLIVDLVRLAPQETRSVRRVTLSTGRRATVDARFSVLNAEGEPRRLHVVLSDVSELRLMEGTLSQRSELLTSLAGLSAQSIAGEERRLAQALAIALAILRVPAGALYVDEGGTLRLVAYELDPDSEVAFPDVLTFENAAPRPGMDLLPLVGQTGMMLLYSPSGITRSLDLDADAVRTAVAACLTAVVAAWRAELRERSALDACARTLDLQETLLERVTTGVILLGAQGQVVLVNRPAARLLGYEVEEIGGMAYATVLVTRRPINDYVQPALEGHAGDPVELVLIARDGNEIPVRFAAAPLGAGSGAGALITLEDLSAHKEKDEHTRDLDRLTFLAEISPVLAHEIRNPLATIKASVQYMDGKVAADDPLHPTMKIIVEEIGRLNLLIADFLTAARPVELRLMPCLLPELLDSLLARRAEELEWRKIEVHRQYATDLPPALADRTRLEQVFGNLIDNAIQAMGQDGHLKLRCDLANGASNDGVPRVRVLVGDNGPGIPPDVKDRIFQPFFTTKKGGTGLGLPISRRIISAHNGMIDVESYPDGGTIFTVTLPAYTQ